MATTKKTTAAKPPRQKKTPTQRAQEALDVATRKVARLEKDQARLVSEHTAVETELAAARVRRDYLANHPDLQAETTPTQTTTEA